MFAFLFLYKNELSVQFVVIFIKCVQLMRAVSSSSIRFIDYRFAHKEFDVGAEI